MKYMCEDIGWYCWEIQERSL